MRLILSLIVILIAVFIGIIGVALVAVPAQLWTVIAGNPDLGPVDFATLKKTSRPNQYLLCPEGICKTETPDAISKTYPFSPVELKEKLKGFGATAQNMVLVHEDNTTLRFVARSPQLKFPDTISIVAQSLRLRHLFQWF